MWLALVSSCRSIENNGTEQHVDATIAPQWKQEARVAARMLGISCFEGCLTIVGRRAALDSRLALQSQLVERRVKIDFVKKAVADRSAVPIGHVRSREIEPEPKWTFKNAN